jgi:redox-sensitive bicupin YhaK (pirin superfamily)
MTAVLAINAKTRDIGGFAVRRALPAIERRMVGPFVFLDQMGPTRLEPGQRLDVRPHPHIGLSTMTYLLEGEVLHRDSLGTVQMIRPGAMNWMTAGTGIVHSERTPEEVGETSVLSGIQFWVALPKSHEEMVPAFVHLEADELPVVGDQKVSARIIAGDAFGARSPLSAPHPMICLDITMKNGASLQPPTNYPKQALYLALGEIDVSGARYAQGQLLILPNQALTIRAASDTRLMLLGGEPIDGPRHMWWNFVSSSKDRIEQAKQDWKQGRFASVPGETEFIPLPQ